MSTEKKLTAMQELVNDFTKMAKSDGDNGFVGRSVLSIIESKKYLEKEKQQIIDSYEYGYSDGMYENGLDTGKQYYNETYKK